MAVTLGRNIEGERVVRELSSNSRRLSSVFERLSSGLRINKGADDAAGLAIASDLKADTRVYSQAVRNLNDSISMLNVAQGSLTQLSTIVTRIKELSTQSLNGTYGYTQRRAMQREADALTAEYNRTVLSTEYNGAKIIDGTDDNVRFQHGYGTQESTYISLGGELNVAAGSGQMDTTASYSLGTTTRGVATGDFNNDGNMDVLRSDGGTGQVLFGNGSGGFTQGSSFSMTTDGGLVQELVAYDFNGDSILDWAGVTRNVDTEGLWVSFGNGDGTFQTARGYAGLGGAGSLRQLTAGDLNNDGVMDLMSADNNSNTLSVYLGNRDGTFQARISSATPAQSTFGVALGDFTGDGILDAISGSNGFLMRGVGDGTFVNGNYTHSFIGAVEYQAGDLNGDGKLDFVAASNHGGGVYVFLGNGNGTFQNPTTYNPTGGGGFSSVTLADFNGDNLLDIATADNANIGILINSGTGTFSTSQSFTGRGDAPQLSTGDFNNDGVADMAVGGDFNGFRTYLGTSDATGRRNPFLSNVNLMDRHNARLALTKMSTIADRISRELGALGALQSRFDTVISNTSQRALEYEAAAGRITDADIASESSAAVRLSILQQVGASVAAQANLNPRIALRLLTNA